MNRWFENLDEEASNIRIEMNRNSDQAMAKWLRIMAITVFGLTAAAITSLFQPIYVLDKLATLGVILLIFQVGILGGYGMSEAIREQIFKKYAKVK